jgi:hypothetical protein
MFLVSAVRIYLVCDQPQLTITVTVAADPACVFPLASLPVNDRSRSRVRGDIGHLRTGKRNERFSPKPLPQRNILNILKQSDCNSITQILVSIHEPMFHQIERTSGGPIHR